MHISSLLSASSFGDPIGNGHKLNLQHGHTAGTCPINVGTGGLARQFAAEFGV